MNLTVNTTFCAGSDVAHEVIDWCSNYLKAEAEAMGMEDIHTYRVVNTDSGIDAVSIAFQVHCPDSDSYRQWLRRLEAITEECAMHWQQRVMPFSTTMHRLH